MLLFHARPILVPQETAPDQEAQKKEVTTSVEHDFHISWVILNFCNYMTTTAKNTEM